jgi:hypothetical protein
MSGFPQLRTTPIFGYGSNSCIQLRARVQNPTLQTFKARMGNYCRIFCLSSKGWGGGAVSSIAPHEGLEVFGSVAYLTDAEIALLDQFEGGYALTNVTFEATSSSSSIMTEVRGKAYIAKNSTYRELPSEQYLTAIYMHLSEHWSMRGQSITVRRMRQGTDTDTDTDATTSMSSGSSRSMEVVFEWYHPFAHGMPLSSLSLEALVIHANAKKAQPWVVPREIPVIVGKLTNVGVRSPGMLLNWVRSKEATLQLQHAMRTSGVKALSAETLGIFKELLLVTAGSVTP